MGGVRAWGGGGVGMTYDAGFELALVETLNLADVVHLGLWMVGWESLKLELGRGGEVVYPERRDRLEVGVRVG